MLLFFLFLLPLIASIILHKMGEDDYSIAIVVWSVIFIVGAAIIFSGQARTRSDIKEFEAFRSTLHTQRVDTVSYAERVSLTLAVIRQNQWLANEQYWCTSLWLNWCYDRSILDVKPIE